MSQARANTIVLLLCAMTLATVVEPVPGAWTTFTWCCRAVGIAMALAALVFPRFQHLALWGVALFLVICPTFAQMTMRAHTAPECYCHDAVLQLEEASRKLRSGVNPYTESFHGTPLERWRAWPENPAVDLLIYPPFLPLLTVPLQSAGERLGFWDERLLLLVFFSGLLVLLRRIFGPHPFGVAATALVALNPWVGPFVVEGRTDAALLFWLAAAVAAYSVRRHRSGHLLLGLAIATKTMLLPAVPFLLLAFRRDAPRCLLLLLGPLAITSLPFLIWDAPAFFGDVFGAPSGLGPRSFEIRGWGGFGFANFVLAAGLVASPRDPFPFFWFQLTATLPCVLLGARQVIRHFGAGRALLWAIATAFLILFFGRFIHDNYIGTLFAAAVLAEWLRQREETPASAAPDR